VLVLAQAEGPPPGLARKKVRPCAC